MIKRLYTDICVFFHNLLTWPDNQIENGVNKTRILPGPFYPISAFEIGDTVSVKREAPGPGGRNGPNPVEEVGIMRLWGEMQPAIRICGLPFHPDEVILLKKLDKNKFPIHGLWQ